MKESEKDLPIFAKWTKFFIDKYKVSILLLIAIALAGIWGISNVQRQDFPAIESNYVVVKTTYIGASASDVEKDVLIPVEQVINNMDNVKNVRSTAFDNGGSIVVERDTADQNSEAANKMNEEIANISLPTDATVKAEALDVAGTSMVLGVVNEGNDDESFTDLLADTEKIKSRIESSSPEIKKVEILPDNEFQVKIKLDSNKMNESSLDYNTVSNTIKSYITNIPGGSVKEEDQNISITIKSPVENYEDLKELKINGVKLDDFADIERAPSNVETLTFGGYKVDGETKTNDAIYLLIYKTDDGDIIRLADDVSSEIENLKNNKVLPQGVEVRTLYNLAPSIDQQIKSLIDNGVLGLVVILIVLLFFINFRTAIVVSLIIPLAFLITMFILPLIGYSLNILTLFAMILTLGILVDNAIVIAEGMAYEMHRGASKHDAGILAVKNLGPAVTAATVTTIIAFIPFSQLPGIMGDFLKYIPFTVIIMLTVSYFLAITITPLFGKWILKDADAKDEFADSEKENKLHCSESPIKNMPKWQKYLVVPMLISWGQSLIDKLNMYYCEMMHWLLAKKTRKVVTVVITILLIGISVGYFAPKLKFEQFPSKDGTNLSVTYDFPTGTTFEEKKDVIKKVNEEIINLPYFEKFYNYGNATQIELTDPSLRSDSTTVFDIREQLISKVDEIKNDIDPDIDIIVDNVTYGPPGSEYDTVIELLSSDSQDLNNTADEMAKFLDDNGDVEEYENVLKEGMVKSVEVDLDKGKLEEYTLNPLSISQMINAMFSEAKLGSISQDNSDITDEVRIGYDNESINSMDKLKDLSIPVTTKISSGPTLYGYTSTTQPMTIKLTDVAQIKEVNKPVSISRYKSRRVVTFNVTLKDGVSVEEFQKQVEDEFDADKLKDLGLQNDALVFGGQYVEFQSDYSNLQIVFLLAAIFVFLVLVFQFNSYSQPLLIMTTIPLALIGVFPGLYMIDPSINLVSGLGIVALVGIVVNDAIVFIDTMNRFSRENPNKTTADNLVKTGFTRLKPIFSTSITTIAGILPLTIIDPFWTGLGVAIIFGLIFSTLGTLVVIPVVYHSFSRKK